MNWDFLCGASLSLWGVEAVPGVGLHYSTSTSEASCWLHLSSAMLLAEALAHDVRPTVVIGRDAENDDGYVIFGTCPVDGSTSLQILVTDAALEHEYRYNCSIPPAVAKDIGIGILRMLQPSRQSYLFDPQESISERLNSARALLSHSAYSSCRYSPSYGTTGENHTTAFIDPYRTNGTKRYQDNRRKMM